MNVCDEKLKIALLKILEEEDAQLEEELVHCEPHIFSQEFEQKISRLMNTHGKT